MAEAATYKCHMCREERPADAFTAAMKKKKPSKRRCKLCTEKTEGSQKLPINVSAGTPEYDRVYLERYVKSKTPTPERIEKHAELKRRILDAGIAASEKCKGDGFIMRFLAARNYDVDKAFAMYKACMEWRVAESVDSILDDPPTKIHNVIKDFHPEVSFGYDRAGCPVYYWRAGRVHAKEVASRVSLEQYVRLHIYMMELGIDKHQKKKKEMGLEHWGETLPVIVDCEGMSLAVRHFLHYFKAAAELDERCYPETMGTVFIVNAPAVFPVIWRLVKPWIDPVTVEKVFIVSGNCTPTLLEHIAPEQLLKDYGGKVDTPEDYRVKEWTEADLAEMKHSIDRETKTTLVANRGSFTEEVTVTEDELRAAVLPEPSPAVMQVAHPPRPKQKKVAVEYYFTTVGNDIKFGVEFVDNKGTKSTLVEPVKCHSHKHAVWGEVATAQPGKFVFHWDNEYSMFTRKTLNYSLRKAEGAILVEAPGQLAEDEDDEEEDAKDN